MVQILSSFIFIFFILIFFWIEYAGINEFLTVLKKGFGVENMDLHTIDDMELFPLVSISSLNEFVQVNIIIINCFEEIWRIDFTKCYPNL